MGVEARQVNPAYSSVLGRVKFMDRYGLTVHQAVALVLARLMLGFSEGIPGRWMTPVGNGTQVAFTVPARKRVMRVCTYWGAVSRQLKPALASQHRTGKRRRIPNPVQAVRWGKPAGWFERGPVRCCWVRVPGGAVLDCWDGGAAETASMADQSRPAKVYHFCSGFVLPP